MNKEIITRMRTRALIYVGIAAVVYFFVSQAPYNPRSLFTQPFLVVATTLLFPLLVWLTARLAQTARTPLGVLFTGLFLFLFNPGIDKCLSATDDGLIDLASQCMVPFFVYQFKRIRKKNFQRGYFLMFLMGIFCSYTHSGVAIPLCASFLWVTWQHRERFFKRACWPMVVGFLIGTVMSVANTTERTDTLPEQFLHISSNTVEVLGTLWATKVFVIAVGVTLYLLNTQSGRQIMNNMVKRHYVVCTSLAFSLISVPLAPLGINNAVTGVCFFSMFWLLFIAKYMTEKYFGLRV